MKELETTVFSVKCHPVIIGFGTALAGIANWFGGWDMGLSTLVILMAVDYITGLMVALIFKKSQKTGTGGFESYVGWKGLCRKGVTLLVVLVACRLDMMVGTNSYIRDAVVICYIANESLSIVENAGLMGVPIPKAITNAIDVLKKKSKEDQEDNQDKPDGGNNGVKGD